MAKNTEQGFRSAAPSKQTSSGDTTTGSIWTTRSASTGRFVQAKTDGATLTPTAERVGGGKDSEEPTPRP